ncbi:MAG: RluA family pseudouridine synthase [Lachnospiraceae bacterium]|nr:RluA family pseudouridine synthase [Lachnospiraceae bacterium]
MEPDIRYEDEDVLVCLKPAGLASQTADITKPDMITLVRKYMKDKGAKVKEPGLIHRLDQPVCGLMLFSKNERSLKELNRQLREGKIRKRYYAIVEGLIEGEEDKGYELVNLIDKDKKNNKALVYDTGSGKNDDPRTPDAKGSAKKAVLVYRIIKKYPQKDLTLLDIDLKTGRFHQIRAQLSHMGHPVICDVKYGGHEKIGQGIGLYAYSLSFLQPKSGKEITVEVSEKSLGMADFLGNL